MGGVKKKSIGSLRKLLPQLDQQLQMLKLKRKETAKKEEEEQEVLAAAGAKRSQNRSFQFW